MIVVQIVSLRVFFSSSPTVSYSTLTLWSPTVCSPPRVSASRFSRSSKKASGVRKCTRSASVSSRWSVM